MTIEEKAEEYARKTLSKDCCDLKLEVYKRTITSYLAGAKELETENNKLLDVINNQDVKIADLEKQIEKLLDWISENGNCCDFCPMTETCRNDEGTCPYASELQKDETKTTKEWVKQKLLKE